MPKVKWENRGRGEWRGDSGGWGSFSLHYSRKSKTWYAHSDPWFGPPTILGHSSTRAGAAAIIQDHVDVLERHKYGKVTR